MVVYKVGFGDRITEDDEMSLIGGVCEVGDVRDKGEITLRVIGVNVSGKASMGDND